MSQIILDLGSGNTCRNDKTYIKRMYDELKAVDTGKHQIIIKWQLFEKAGDNIPLLPESFDYAYEYGKSLGYPVTASVFDKHSLDFLLEYDVPFVKIANNRKLDWLIGKIPRDIPVYVSVSPKDIRNDDNIDYLKKYGMADRKMFFLGCVSKYPSELGEYKNLGLYNYSGYSDHTINWDFYNFYKESLCSLYKNTAYAQDDKLKIINRCLSNLKWEVHYKLNDSTGLDAGPFARTPGMLREVL